MPIGKNLLEEARSTRCLANLRQMGGAAMQYAAEHNGDIPPAYLPTSSTDSLIFYRLLNQYLGPHDHNADISNYPKVYRCPSDKEPFLGGVASYGCNAYVDPGNGRYSSGNIYNFTSRGAPLSRSQVILYIDASKAALQPEWGANYSQVAFRHNHHANAVMMDGSATHSFLEDSGLLGIPVNKSWGAP